MSVLERNINVRHLFSQYTIHNSKEKRTIEVKYNLYIESKVFPWDNGTLLFPYFKLFKNKKEKKKKGIKEKYIESLK